MPFLGGGGAEGGGAYCFRGSWPNLTLRDHRTLNCKNGSFDGCSTDLLHPRCLYALVGRAPWRTWVLNRAVSGHWGLNTESKALRIPASAMRVQGLGGLTYGSWIETIFAVVAIDNVHAAAAGGGRSMRCCCSRLTCQATTESPTFQARQL